MPDGKVNVFLPCRKGSERVRRKNTRRFAHFSFGLIEIKLAQLVALDSIDKIYLSTDDIDILDFANGLSNNKIIPYERSDSLAASTTSTDELIEHACQIISEGPILWTHVTSPFCNSYLYDEIIKSYFKVLADGFDSLMTVTELQGFIWDERGPLNYDRTVEKWPRTQTLSSLYEVNSAAFISSRENYVKYGDRIGLKPYYFEVSKTQGFDIDWPEDFRIAEAMANSFDHDIF